MQINDLENYANKLHDFLYVNSSLLRTAGLWNFLPAKCFPLNYDLNGFNYRVNSHMPFLGSF